MVICYHWLPNYKIYWPIMIGGQSIGARLLLSLPSSICHISPGSEHLAGVFALCACWSVYYTTKHNKTKSWTLFCVVNFLSTGHLFICTDLSNSQSQGFTGFYIIFHFVEYAKPSCMSCVLPSLCSSANHPRAVWCERRGEERGGSGAIGPPGWGRGVGQQTEHHHLGAGQTHQIAHSLV